MGPLRRHAERPRWSATKSPWPCAFWCPSSPPGSMNLTQLALDQSRHLELEPVPRSVPARSRRFGFITPVPLPVANGQPVRSGGSGERTRRRLSIRNIPGFRWLVIFMAEYGSMFAVGGIAMLDVPGRLEHRAVKPFELTDVFSVSVPSFGFGDIFGSYAAAQAFGSATCFPQRRSSSFAQVLVPGLHHDVDSLDVAAATDRSGDDGLLEVHRADGMRAGIRRRQSCGC